MSEKTYRVTAPTKVFGIEPGETFTREIPEVQEARLIKSRAIQALASEPGDPVIDNEAFEAAVALGLDVDDIEPGDDNVIDLDCVLEYARDLGLDPEPSHSGGPSTTTRSK